MSIVNKESYDREYFGYLFTKYDDINKLSKREKKFFKAKFSALECTLKIKSLSDIKIAKQFRIPVDYVSSLRKDNNYYLKIIQGLNIEGENNPDEIKEINRVLNENIDIIIRKRQDGYSFTDINCKLRIPYETKSWAKISSKILDMEDGVNLHDTGDINFVLKKLKKGKSLSEICKYTKLFRDDIDIVDCLERNNIDTKEFLNDEDYTKYILPVIEYAKNKRLNTTKKLLVK